MSLLICKSTFKFKISFYFIPVLKRFLAYQKTDEAWRLLTDGHVVLSTFVGFTSQRISQVFDFSDIFVKYCEQT